MGGSQTTVEQGSSQSINEIPQWVQNAGQANYGLAQQVASQPLQQYQGQMVASVSPQTQQAWNLAANSGNVGVGAQNAAQAGYMNTLAQTPRSVYAPVPTVAQAQLAPAVKAAQAAAAQQAAGSKDVTAAQSALSQLSNTNLAPYMNPYTQSVINATLPIYQQQLQNTQAQNAAQAVAGGAFGGSRFGIQQGVTQAQGAMGMAQMAEQLNQANFAQAQAAGQFDVGQANQMGEFNANQMNQVAMANQQQRNAVNMYNAGQGNQVSMFNAGQQNQVNLADMQAANQMAQFNTGAINNMRQFNAGEIMQAQQLNQNAALQQEALVNQASQGLGTLGNQQMQNNLAQYGMLTSAGGFEQQQSQNEINAQMAKFNQAFTYPQQQLGIQESALGMTPYNTGTSGSSASTTTQTQNNPMAMGLGALQTLTGLFNPFNNMMGGSDRKLKTDIQKVGKHPTGVGIYSYRYKGDPKHYPKVVGPMAEDVQKIAPHAVSEIPGSGGKKMVHMPTLNALSTPPSSPGVAKAIGMLGKGTPGVLSTDATPPSRSLLPRKQREVPGASIIGALGG